MPNPDDTKPNTTAPDTNVGDDKDIADDLDLSGLDEAVATKVKTALATSNAQKKHWRDKATKEAELAAQKEAELADLRKRLPPPPAPPEPPKQQTPQASAVDEDWKKRTDFLLQHRDFSTEDFNDLTALSKGYGISLEEAMKSDAFQVLVDKRKREREKQAAGLPGNSPSSKVDKGDDVELTDEEKIQAQKMGISEERMKKTKAKLVAARQK